MEDNSQTSTPQTPESAKTTPINQSQDNQAYREYVQAYHNVVQTQNINTPTIENISEMTPTNSTTTQNESITTKANKNNLNPFLETLAYMAAVFVFVLVIRYFIMTPFLVSGSSMEPNMFNGELILVNKIGYNFGTPERGDVVVIVPPDSVINDYYIKRIIGMPGEKLEFRDGDVIIYNDEYPDGVTLSEPYLKANNHKTMPIFENKRLTVGSNEYFVLGDNRLKSRDSRAFGAVNKRNIVGETMAIIFPPQNMSVIDGPEYNF